MNELAERAQYARIYLVRSGAPVHLVSQATQTSSASVSWLRVVSLAHYTDIAEMKLDENVFSRLSVCSSLLFFAAAASLCAGEKKRIPFRRLTWRRSLNAALKLR